MDEKIFQIIFDEVAAFLPNQWSEVVIYLEHGEEAYSYSFYVKVNGKFVKCYDIEGISENELFSAFSKIEKSVSEARSKMDNCWSNMTMVVKRDGTMKTEFDYTDLSSGNYQYKKLWKKKYLV